MQIINTKPQVGRVKEMKEREKERLRLKRLHSSRFATALRIKSRADRMLEEKYGQNGNSARLFK